MPSLDDYRGWQKEQGQREPKQDTSSTVRLAVLAAVAMETLTNSSEWNYYL